MPVPKQNLYQYLILRTAWSLRKPFCRARSQFPALRRRRLQSRLPAHPLRRVQRPLQAFRLQRAQRRFRTCPLRRARNLLQAHPPRRIQRPIQAFLLRRTRNLQPQALIWQDLRMPCHLPRDISNPQSWRNFSSWSSCRLHKRILTGLPCPYTVPVSPFWPAHRTVWIHHSEFSTGAFQPSTRCRPQSCLNQ